MTFGLHFWSSPLQALALFAGPRLGLRHFRFVAHELCGILILRYSHSVIFFESFERWETVEISNF